MASGAGHDYTPPVFKGAKLYRLNATTGKESGAHSTLASSEELQLQNGHTIWPNGYDNQLNRYAKGPNQTGLFQHPQGWVSTSTPITISGNIFLFLQVKATSKSSKIPQPGYLGDPDASMTPFMEAVYQ